MEKYKKYWIYLFLMLSISLTILVINNINSSVIPQIIQDINSGVIGAILTTIITLLLLSNQTESQENLTKSSVVYEEKLKIFNSFLETIGNCLEDGKLTAQETSKIIHSFSILRIHISTKNSKLLETAISSIDNSFFFFDENNVPNLNRLIELYNKITNVFREELYGTESKEQLNPFDFSNLKNVLYRQRLSILKPNNFNDLMGVLKSNSRILHTKSGVTIVYQIDDEVIASLKLLYDFIEQIIGEISKEISFTYEINTKFINGEKFCGIPWIKIHYKNKNFAYFGLSETKRLMIGKNIPENKQVASLELFETNDLEIYRNQIFQEFKKIVSELDKHQ
jgi:hypothetical protein